MRFDARFIAAAAAASATLVACAADTTAPGVAGPRSMTVSFATSGSATGSASLASLVSGSAAATDSIRITRAQLVMARLELERSGASCTSEEVAGDDDRDYDDHDDCEELELSPTVVDLPVDSTVSNKLQVSVPSGTYSALEATIGPVKTKRGKGSTAFLAAHPDLANVSVRVEGTFNGKAFTYTGSPRAEFETSFNPPIVVDSSGINVTINVDLRTWFKNRAGDYIDPSTANGNGANAALVADNIRRSFRAFRDDDRNGHDDREERGGRRN
jgi:hypothetical protein